MDSTTIDEAPLIYSVGGNVQAAGGIYITRKADDDLFELCRKGIFAYVLAPRQVGKSSLMVHTAERLAADGIRSVIIDLSEIGAQLDEQAWYLGLVTSIVDQLGLPIDVTGFWQSINYLSSAQRLSRFLHRELLAAVPEQIVIFIDEIDTTLSLNFTDDFFALIRSVYDARARDDTFERLSFVLVGVATPGDLIRDHTRTPFNIGRPVELQDFRFKEALPLTRGLNLPDHESTKVLTRVLMWTGGHPYLTQRLLLALTEQDSSAWSDQVVDHVVQRTFFGDNAMQDTNVQFVRDMLVRHQHTVDRTDLLTTYRDIRRGKRVFDDEHSQVKHHLKLSGVVGRTKGQLKVRNRIYWQIFDVPWVTVYIPINWRKRLQYLALGVIVLLVATIVVTGALAQAAWGRLQEANRIIATVQGERQQITAERLLLARTSSVITRTQQAVAREQQENQAIRATADARVQGATQTEAVAIAARQTAEAERAAADTQREGAISAQVMAEARRAAAQQRAQSALVERDSAVKARDTAVSERQLADAQRQTAEAERAAAQTAEQLAVVAQRAAEAQSLRALNALASAVTRPPDTSVPAVATPTRERTPVVATPTPGSIAATSAISLSVLLQTEVALTSTLIGAAFSPDGASVAIVGVPRYAYVLDVRNGMKIIRTLSKHTKSIQSVAFSRDGARIVTTSNDGTACLWDVGTEAEPRVLNDEHKQTVISAAFSLDSQRVVTGSGDGSISIWDAETGRLIHTIPDAHGNEVRSIDYSANGRFILSASRDGTAKLWETQNFTNVGTIDDPSGGLYSASFSPSGNLIITGGSGNVAKLWAVSPGTNKDPISVFSGHTGTIRSAMFSPDGRWIVTASEDGSVRFWDILGHPIGEANVGGGEVYRAVYNPIGTLIVTVSKDGKARLWSIIPISGQL